MSFSAKFYCRPRRQACREGEIYLAAHARVYAYEYVALRDNMRENEAGTRTEKEILLFRAESAKVVSASDYDV